MSRMPPVPAASQPAYGPGAVPKTSVTDLPHHADLPFQRSSQQQGNANRDATKRPARRDTRASSSEDERNETASLQERHSETWMLVALGAVIAAIFCVANRPRRRVF